MLNDIIIADATAHAYNWIPENFAAEESQRIVAGSWAFHQGMTADRPDLRLSEQEFKQDWQSQDISEALFFETGIDFVSYHGTPIFDFFKDGHSATGKGFELLARYPDRVIVYAGINPWAFETAQEIRDEVDRLVDLGATGLKLYAARYERGATLPSRMDDEKHAFPMIERAIERGVRVIASHKAIPIGPVNYEPYGVGDFPHACATFPEMKFEVVHSGMAFVQETAFLASTQPNCYFNLETSFAIQTRQPRRFAEFLGALLRAGAADRILYASGFSLFHPLLALQSFLDFQMPDDLVTGFGMPQVTDEVKEKILGLNYLRMHGIDPAEFRTRISGDQVSKRQAHGLEAPWSNVRARLGAGGEDANRNS
ncbi:amidohydrolase family protein [Streptomyces sp. NBC_01622]|uniref:amidohydrolase family protein n=1 Tax=Streptomyces sp. NBC_01622 TaxID=2975903 RepID=UPI003866F8F6|nr:amidohydrolase family protein [Streptomyces sp. NBC_01622]